jgi:streptogramin lyase
MAQPLSSRAAARVLAVVLSLGASSAAIRAQIVEYPTGGAGPESIATGSDGALWFTESAGNKIGRITTQGAVTEFPLAGNPGPAGIAAGADGNLWFTERVSSKIGRITTAGVVTEFPTPTPSAEPVGITAAGDGNLWFTERIVSKICRITTQGVITEFPLGGSAFPRSITEGSDGNLWFTADNVAAIGRMTTTGALQSFAMAPLPGFSGAAGFSQGITTGPDGKIWFTVATPPVAPNFVYSGAIGRLDPQSCNGIGTCTPEAFLLAGLVFPLGLASGPDGALWVADRDGNMIGRVSTAGALLSHTPIPTAASSPRGIVLGPDGNLWFTESASDKIGRIDGGASPPGCGTGRAHARPMPSIASLPCITTRP